MGLKRSRLSLPTAEYKKLCREVMQRDGYKCRCCKVRQNLHCHHIVYRSHGGGDIRSNLVTLCDTCHAAVHSRYLLVRWLGEVVDADKPLRWECIDGWKPGKKL